METKGDYMVDIFSLFPTVYTLSINPLALAIDVENVSDHHHSANANGNIILVSSLLGGLRD